MSHDHYKRVGILIVSTTTISIILWIFFPRDHLFTLIAHSDEIQIALGEQRISTRLPYLQILHCEPQTTTRDTTPENGTEYVDADITIANNATLSIRRYAYGATSIEITPTNTSWGLQLSSRGRLINCFNQVEVVVDTFPPNKTTDIPKPDRGIILSFQGAPFVGQDLASGVRTTLIAGHVALAERMPFAAGRRVVRQWDLDPGDLACFAWNGDRGSRQCLAAASETDPRRNLIHGFVRIDPRSVSGPGGLTIVAHSLSDFVQVLRYGSEGYVIAASFLDRLATDPAATTFLFVIAVVVALGEIFKAVQSTHLLLGSGKPTQSATPPQPDLHSPIVERTDSSAEGKHDGGATHEASA